MGTYSDKAKENKISVLNKVVQKKKDDGLSIQSLNSRPEHMLQKKLQETANNSTQVRQLKSLQTMADDFMQQPLQMQAIENTKKEEVVQRASSDPLLSKAEQKAANAVSPPHPNHDTYDPPVLPGMAPRASRSELGARTSMSFGGSYTPPVPSASELLASSTAAAAASANTAARASLDAEDRAQAALRNRSGLSAATGLARGEAGERLLPDSEALSAHRVQERKKFVKSKVGQKGASALLPGLGAGANALHTASQGHGVAVAASQSGDHELSQAGKALASSKYKKGGSQAVSAATGIGAGALVGQAAIPVPIVGAVIGAVVGFLASTGVQKGADTLLHNKDELRAAADIICKKAQAGDHAAIAIFEKVGIGPELAMAHDNHKALYAKFGV